jgi:hypothetical protein
MRQDQVKHELGFRWMKVGAKEAIPFTEGAVDAIAAWSHGIARLISAICDNALLISFSESTRTVEMRHIRESDGSDVPSASVTVNMAGCTPGHFVYGAMGPYQPADRRQLLSDQPGDHRRRSVVRLGHCFDNHSRGCEQLCLLLSGSLESL